MFKSFSKSFDKYIEAIFACTLLWNSMRKPKSWRKSCFILFRKFLCLSIIIIPIPLLTSRFKEVIIKFLESPNNIILRKMRGYSPEKALLEDLLLSTRIQQLRLRGFSQEDFVNYKRQLWALEKLLDYIILFSSLQRTMPIKIILN